MPGFQGTRGRSEGEHAVSPRLVSSNAHAAAELDGQVHGLRRPVPGSLPARCPLRLHLRLCGRTERIHVQALVSGAGPLQEPSHPM